MAAWRGLRLFDDLRDGWTSQKTIVATIAGLWLLLCLYMLLFYDSMPVSSISARTERVLVRIVNDDLGTISLAGLARRSDDPFSSDSLACESGVFIPSVGAIVEYVRMAEGDLRISIFPAVGNSFSGAIHPASGTRLSVESVAHFVASPDCGAENQSSRYPVWGPVALGDDIRAPVAGSDPPSALLLEGKIQISGRSATLFGLLPPTLYEASEINLPMGSRVSEVGRDDMPAGTLWAGYVAVPKENGALEFRAQTEARNLKIYLPGQAQGADQIRVGLIMPLFQDPYLLMVQVVFAAFFIVLEKFINLLTYLFPRRNGQR